VFTLAFTGFPDPIVRLKHNIEKMPFLQPENPGSKSPKITLGAVNDGKKLTRKDIYKIREICDQHNLKLTKTDLSCSRYGDFFCLFFRQEIWSP